MGIFLGYGNGSFTNQISFLTGSSPLSIAVNDFNNDAELDSVVANSIDIIVTNYDGNNVVVLLGRGDGNFEARKEFLVGYGTYPFQVVVGHFNNDTKLDFAVANYGTDNLQIQIQTC